jgi:hypothetical protein
MVKASTDAVPGDAPAGSLVAGVNFGFLTCAPHHVPSYQRPGWRSFLDEIFIEQPRRGTFAWAF